MKKKTSSLLTITLGLILSATAQLGAGGYCCEDENPCCADNQFIGQFKALFLQPTCSNLSYAAEAFPLPAPSPNWRIHSISPNYHFGYDIELGYIDRNCDTKLQFNWTHFDSKDTASTTTASSDMIGPFFEIGPDAAAYTVAHGKATFHYDAANLDYGFLVDFRECLRANFFAGVGYSRINQKLSSRFSNADGTIVRTIHVPSTFNGAGPQVGVDFAYNFNDCLQFTGKAMASLLVGTQKNHTSYGALSPALADLGITPPNNQKTSVHNKTQVVPAFEGKLGVGYSFDICDKYVVNLEAGYEAKLYINAIQSVDISSEVVTPPVLPDTVGVFARTFHTTLSNFALAGPYVSVNVGF